MENELRLGNLFILRGKIVEFDDKLMHSVIYGGLEGSKPIPLTEEWLLKFGFVWSIQHQAHYLYKFDYVIDICEGFSRVIKYRRNGEELIKIQYVHELQNLYFALTKEKLTMK